MKPWEQYSQGAVPQQANLERFSFVPQAPAQPAAPAPWEQYGSSNQFAGQQPQQDPLEAIDYNQDIEQLRPQIEALPEDLRDEARNRWAAKEVERERAGGVKVGGDVAKGIPIIGGLLDEAGAGLSQGLNTLTGGALGRPYSEAIAVERARDAAASKAAPLTTAASQFAAGLVGGAPLTRLFSAPTLAGQVGRGVAAGGALGAGEGFARGEGGFENRMESAQGGAAGGALFGAAIPVAGAALARGKGAYDDFIRPGVTRMRFGPERAADEIIANRIQRSGQTPGQVQQQLDDIAENARFGPNSRAEAPTMLADVSDDMQRLTGSTYRAGGQAGNVVRDAIESRQRGGSPYTVAAPNARDVAEGTTQQGQGGRIFDTVRRALLVRSRDGAPATERQIIREQRDQGRQLYDDAYNNDQGFDLGQSLTAMGARLNEFSGSMRNKLQSAVDLFARRAGGRGYEPVATVRRFDAAKKQLDDMIETAGRQGEGNLQRLLTEFKNNLLDDVHAGGRNETYRQARQAWGTQAERREAVEMGRAALREDSATTVEDFMQMSPGNQVLFRIGLVDAVRRANLNKRGGQDVTQLFDTNRAQQLMNAVIPRPRSGNAVFANRAQRFGDTIAEEQRRVGTRQAVLGNSATASRLQDDAEFTGQTLQTIWNRFRSSPGLANMILEGVGYGIQRVFAYRQDVALQLAQRLVSANPAQQRALLTRLAERHGPDTFQRFTELVDDVAGRAMAIGAEGSGEMAGQGND